MNVYGWIASRGEAPKALYPTPELALLLIDDEFTPLALWEGDAKRAKRQGVTVQCKSLTAMRLATIPTISPDQRVDCAIRCALAVYDRPFFQDWAKGWLADGSRERRKRAIEAVLYDPQLHHDATRTNATPDAMRQWTVLKGLRCAATSAENAVEAAMRCRKAQHWEAQADQGTREGDDPAAAAYWAEHCVQEAKETRVVLGYYVASAIQKAADAMQYAKPDQPAIDFPQLIRNTLAPQETP